MYMWDSQDGIYLNVVPGWFRSNYRYTYIMQPPAEY